MESRRWRDGAFNALFPDALRSATRPKALKRDDDAERKCSNH
jgi:hypothetical protein